MEVSFPNRGEDDRDVFAEVGVPPMTTYAEALKVLIGEKGIKILDVRESWETHEKFTQRMVEKFANQTLAACDNSESSLPRSIS